MKQLQNSSSKKQEKEEHLGGHLAVSSLLELVASSCAGLLSCRLYLVLFYLARCHYYDEMLAKSLKWLLRQQVCG